LLFLFENKINSITELEIEVASNKQQTLKFISVFLSKNFKRNQRFKKNKKKSFFLF